MPALLAYLADATEDNAVLRVRAMSYFELALLAGLALGGVIAAQLYRALHTGSFAVVALAYVACAATFFVNVSPTAIRRIRNPLGDVRDVLALTALRRLRLHLHICLVRPGGDGALGPTRRTGVGKILFR